MGNEASRQRGIEGSSNVSVSNAPSQLTQTVVIPQTPAARLPPPIKDPLYRSK
jgi:hypothetical protein